MAVKDQVIHFLSTHGADPQNTGIIFQFTKHKDLLQCRDEMKVAIPQAFHDSPVTIANWNARFGQYLPDGPIPLPVDMAKCFIILEYGGREDGGEDENEDVGYDLNFFYR